MKSDGFLWQAFLIFAACAYTPLRVWAGTPESSALLTSALVIVALTALGLGIRAIFVAKGADRLGTTYAVAIFFLAFLSTGLLVEWTTGGRWIGLGIGVLLSGIAYRLRDMGLFRLLMAWGAFFLLLLPILSYLNTSNSGEITISANNALITSGFESHPDVVVIVLDGYPSDSVLREFHDFDNSAFYSDLGGVGMTIDQDVRSNFPATMLSVANTLNLDYLVGEQHLSPSDIEFLYEMLGGNNPMARILRENGYSQTVVESGWLNSRCQSMVDECVAMPWPDETVFGISMHTLLRGAPGFEVGYSFSRGARHSLGWLENDLEPLLRNDVSDYVYVHVLAPHPPFFLTSSCEMNPTKALSGFTTGAPGLTREQVSIRSEGYVDQIRCLNGVLPSVAEAAIENDAIIVMFGDHGSDTGGQLFLEGSEWTDADIRERFGPFFAGYGPGCDFDHLGSLVNVSRRIVACLSGDHLPDLATRAFVHTKDWDLTEIEMEGSILG
ncbi:MAG TPA: hypothetical protein VI193_07025 [Acidimicrobiia bacterium]